MNKIIALNALQDNYIWVIPIDANSVIVVDPGCAEPVLNYLKQYALTLKGILLTHHHNDHSGGILSLLEKYPTIPVYSSKIDSVSGVTHTVQEGDKIEFARLEAPIEILEIPGHTLGHLAFIYKNAVFTGDMLFSVGAGKIFEGTAKQMYHSLSKLKALSKNSEIYCGHEYTLANITFAQTVDPDNPLLQNRKIEVENLKQKGRPSVPVLLEIELQTNPFLRCEHPDIIRAVEAYSKKALESPIEVLLKLREWKNQFRN